MKTEKNRWFQKLETNASMIGIKVYLIPELVVDYTKHHTGYQPSEEKIINEVIILLNWPKIINYQKAVEWGIGQGLRKTTSHVTVAMEEQKPKLNDEIGKNPVNVVETTGCIFNLEDSACGTRWNFDQRLLGCPPQKLCGSTDDWFVFRK